MINSLWIVTAAHCVSGRASQPSRFRIGLGLFDRNVFNSWTIFRTATRIIIHESYSSWTFSNDIALIKLDVSKKFKRNKLNTQIDWTQIIHIYKLITNLAWVSKLVN